MKNYTKQITAFAALSLFAYSANAQVASVNFTGGGPTDGPTAGMTIAPANGVAATNLITNTTGFAPGTPITDSTTVQGVTTVTTETQLGQAAPSADYTSNNVVGGGSSSVVINNEGITLNQVETTANAVVVNAFITEVVTVTSGNPSTTVTTWTSELRDANNVVIAGSQSTYNDIIGDPAFGTRTDATDDLTTFVTGLVADDPILASATTPTPGTPTGGNLTVGGNLAVGAIADVEAAVTANTAKVGVTDASVAATTAVTANTAKVGVTDASVAATTAVTANTDNITTLNGDNTIVGSVANSIAGALENTGVSENGIEGVIEKQITGEFAGSIKLGGNSFFFNDTTDTIATTSGVINLDADVNIDGDLNIAGLTGDVASRINSNSSRIASNKKDIEQNTRGIAMVAALQHTTVLPGMNNAFDLSAAHFEGETGLALNFARRINENVQINFGAASTTDFDESVIKAGIGVQW